MKRLLLIGFAACVLTLAPTLSASAMPAATPAALGGSDVTGQTHRVNYLHLRRGLRGPSVSPASQAFKPAMHVRLVGANAAKNAASR
jgi:hypothetical protein